MPIKIGFSVISSTGEDERYRATDLNYHGPTVKGWRSAQNCHYPQDITLQLHSAAVVHRIQILAHQYLIPQKIEIWTCEDLDYDPSRSPSELQCFQYLGFVTLSDNRSTGFKSRELKSVTTPPTPARFVRLRLYENHYNERNIYNQVGLVAVSVLGDIIPPHDLYNDDVNNNGQNDSLPTSDANLISNPQYTSPYDDLAFEMYVDNDVARIMRLMEKKKHRAVMDERFEYARKLKLALEHLREAGETLGRYEQEKRQAINLEDYEKAKVKKNQIEKYRDKVYTSLHVEQLLELNGHLEENDTSMASVKLKELKRGDEQGGDESDISTATPNELEVDTRLHQQSPSMQSYRDIQSPQSSEHRPTWSPQRIPRNERPSRPGSSQRRPSLSDYPSMAPSPNPLSHSFSHSSFPTSSSNHHLYLNPTELTPAQFQCYTSYSYHPALSICNQPMSLDSMYKSLPPIQLQESYCDKSKTDAPQDVTSERAKSPLPTSPNNNNSTRSSGARALPRARSKSTVVPAKSSYEDYEERMLPALRHPQVPTNDIIRECHVTMDQMRKSKLNEREKKQASLPILVFGIEMVEKFYSKHFADKEEGLRLLQDELKSHIKPSNDTEAGTNTKSSFSANKIARASIFLLHRALRDKVYSVYSAAADSIRFFFHDFVPGRVASTEVARSVEKLLPELLAKSGDVTPRIHNMAAHTLLSMVDCKQVRDLHIIPVQLSRPLSSTVHPRLALSRLEMVEQLILNHGISTEKQSGLTCRTLAEFGSSGLHHPAEAVRKVSERILLQVYKFNPRLVRKQLPPDDDVTRRNLLYRQLFQEFDFMDLQRRREEQLIACQTNATVKPLNLPLPKKELMQPTTLNCSFKNSVNNFQPLKVPSGGVSQTLKKTVNQQTSPMNPVMLSEFKTNEKEANHNRLRFIAPSKPVAHTNYTNKKISAVPSKQSESLLPRRNMSRISEEANDAETEKMTIEPIHHFPNLVDSVHVTEHRLASEQNSTGLQSMRYIFPTSYIGTSVSSQETVKKSNHPAPSAKINGEPRNGLDRRSKFQFSGIPIPKNGFNGKNKLNSIISARKCIQSSVSFTKPSSSTIETLDKNDMITAVYIPSNPTPQDENSSSGSAVTPPNEGNALPGPEKDGKPYKKCIFCLTKDDTFTKESLNMHYWKNCPMLTRCSQCKEVVEISGLIQHRLDDCEYRKSFIKCDRCQEAVFKEDWNEHNCKYCQANKSHLRCPLCHNDLASGQDWREHLMGSNVCPYQPRRNLVEN